MKTVLSQAISVAASALISGLCSSSTFIPAHAFSTPRQPWSNCRIGGGTERFMLMGSTTTTRPDTETDKKLGSSDNDFKISQGNGVSGPLEYNIDETSMDRNMDDPFHILLMGETFTDNERITIDYVASSCSYVLGMPYDEAAEIAAHTKEAGLSCLGTWSREECLNLGRKLQQRDLVCRVVPFCEGGQRGWQARDANTNNEGDVKQWEEAGSGDRFDSSGWD